MRDGRYLIVGDPRPGQHVSPRNARFFEVTLLFEVARGTSPEQGSGALWQIPNCLRAYVLLCSAVAEVTVKPDIPIVRGLDAYRGSGGGLTGRDHGWREPA